MKGTFAAALASILLFSIALNIWQWRMIREGERQAAGRDTVTIIDTVRYTQVVPKDSIVVRYIERTFKVTDTILVQKHDTILDSIRVEVPIKQRTYQDSTYRAWVSGYEARLDSIEVYSRETIIRPGRRRWSVGLQAGYGITTKGLGPYAGIGVTFTPW